MARWATTFWAAAWSTTSDFWAVLMVFWKLPIESTMVDSLELTRCSMLSWSTIDEKLLVWTITSSISTGRCLYMATTRWSSMALASCRL